MGAAYLCGIAGIENRTIENSAAYINGWLSKLRRDPTVSLHVAQRKRRRQLTTLQAHNQHRPEALGFLAHSGRSKEEARQQDRVACHHLVIMVGGRPCIILLNKEERHGKETRKQRRDIVKRTDGRWMASIT